ncbi:MAG: P-loop NTPase [Thermodesulfobacteriota bacterium]|nr:P-loop NTPase [Thermodesulfobacteriota bacterium]
METEAKSGIRKLQVDFTCDFRCEKCERFFQCKNPEKLKIFDRRRMSRARKTMGKIKRKIAVCAGKGGVGKSMLTTNLAVSLAMGESKVAVMDSDFDGSCIPRMLGALDKKLALTPKGIEPVEGFLGIKVVAMANIMDEEDTTTWFHELRRNATEEFVAHVNYGELDYLLIDLPPGTSSDAVNTMEYIPDLDGMVIVTNPTEVSQGVALRAGMMAIEGGVKIIGIIENMSGYVCGQCKNVFYPLKKGGAKVLAKQLQTEFLGRVPLDPKASYASDHGVPFVHATPESPASEAVRSIVEKIIEIIEQ